MIRGARAIALVALLAALFSFAKFDHCRNSGWGSPDVYVHMCYSDLSALYGARGISNDQWPYTSAENSVEYPVVTGVVMWLTGKLIKDPNGYRQYFDINALFLALLMIVASLLVWRLRPEFAALFPLAPAVIGSLYINWDLWAVVPALLSLYLFAIHKRTLSAIALGIAIATKFFPVVLLIGFLLSLWQRKKWLQLWSYLGITSLSWAAINIPVALQNFDGWWRFFKLNIERGNDLGSLWYALTLLNQPTINISWLTGLLYIFAVISIVMFYRYVADPQRENENLWTVSFLLVAAFVTMSRVYSPQYIIWLTPLAVIAITRKEERSAFWIWQGGEALYHLAIWQYLATFTGARFGMPASIYALAIILRISTLAWFSATLIRTALSARSTASTSSTSLQPQFSS
jgi:uncharacterized membrane protein